MKILRPFTGTGAVFFPVGLPPVGTCEFATPECLKECYTYETSWGNGVENFDDEIRIGEADKQFIYDAFINWEMECLIKEILFELAGLQTHIFHWFGSGDCQTKNIDRLSNIIRILSTKGITQMGFTRNREFWERNKDILALTVNDESEMTDLKAIYAVPDFENCTSIMCSPKYQVRGGYCGPIICSDRDRKNQHLDHYINCKICHRLQLACFDRR
jgi:hypothetical protein